MNASLDWRKDHYIGFVDESGSMSKDDEVHVVAGLFIPENRRGQVQALATRLMEMTPPILDRKGKHRWPKASAMPRNGCETYVDGLHNTGTIWCCVRRDVLESNGVVRQNGLRAAAAFKATAQLLTGADALDLRPGTIISAYEQEVTRHPIYSHLVYRFLADAANRFRQMKLVPTIKLCFDDKFQRCNGDVLQFLTRYLFYTTLKEAGDFTIADIFGLQGTRAFSAYINKDPDEACLYLADIYAHACGMVCKGLDQDGYYRYFLKQIDESCGTTIWSAS